MSSREAKIKYLLALEERNRRAKAAPLLYWTPHERQSDFIEVTKNYRVGVATGGNRSGKTNCITALAVEFGYGYYIHAVPDLKLGSDGDYPPRSEIDPQYWIRRPDGVPIRNPARILVVTGQAMQRGVGAALWPYIEGFIPPAARASGDFSVQRGPYSVPVRAQLPNGSEYFFGSAEQDVGTFESVPYDVCFSDEPLPRRLFGAIWRGLIDYYGRLICAMTPLGENSMFLWSQFFANPSSDAKFIQMSIHDNPHLSQEAVAEAIAQWPDDERATRETGAWQFMSHRAFPQFDPGIHVCQPHEIPEGWIRGVSVDPAHRRPFAITWAAFGPNDEVLVYREWPAGEHHKITSSTLTCREYASILRNEEGGEKIDFRVLDPRFGAAHHRIKGEVTTSIQEDFADLGLYFDCRIEGTEREETGIEEIRRLLRFDRSCPVSALNRPKLMVMKNCVNTVNSLSMSNFVPPDKRDPTVLPEKLLESFKDFRDNLRYLVLYPRPYTGNTEGMGYISEQELDAHNTFGV